MQSQRTFIWEGREKTVSGREVRGTYDDKVQKKLFYKGSEYADEDFWRFYMGEETLSELGYEEIFKEEYQFDRQFVGLRDKEGHVLLLSNIIEFSVPFPEAPGCPCKYTFAIFTDDERVAISN